MITDPLHIAQLIRRKFNNELTEEEIYALQKWSEQDFRNARLIQELEDEVKKGMNTQVFDSFDSDRSWSMIHKKKRKQFVLYWSRIAAVLAVIGMVSFFMLRINGVEDNNRIVESKDVRYKNDILPAIKGAKIVLADGNEIKVDDDITLLEDGSITTEKKKTIITGDAISLNKLVVPAANFLTLTLSDGTKVSVNASSELVFPNRFAKDRREVKLKGEAYFKVAKNSKSPFTVETPGGNVKVLGTSFNVSAYDDRPITTLEEGQVLLYHNEVEEILSPGTQGQIMGNRIDVRKADLEKELAWKNNSFYFKGDNIVTIAKQLQTWYDIDVSLSKGVSLSHTYTGEISRGSNLSEVLKMLEFVSDLVFKVDNNKLLILKDNKV